MLVLYKKRDDVGAEATSFLLDAALQEVVAEAGLGAYVSETAQSSHEMPSWSVVAQSVEGTGNGRILSVHPLRALVFLEAGTTFGVDDDRELLASEQIDMADYSRGAFDVRLFRLKAATWLNGLLPPERVGTAEQRMASVKTKVEALITAVQLHVLENEQLQGQLDESELVINQLRAQVQTLEAELRRKRLSPRRVGFSNGVILTVVLSAVSSFGAGYGGAASRPHRAEARARAGVRQLGGLEPVAV